MLPFIDDNCNIGKGFEIVRREKIFYLEKKETTEIDINLLRLPTLVPKRIPYVNILEKPHWFSNITFFFFVDSLYYATY